MTEHFLIHSFSDIMEPTRILLFVFLIHSLRKLTVLSYNILVLPRPVYSHVRSVKVMMDILINEYQHNITLLLTDSVAKHPSLKDIRAEIVTYDKDGKFTKNLDELSSKAYENGFNSMGPLSMVPYIQSMAAGFTHSIMTDSEIYNKLEGRSYRTMILDGMDSMPFLLLALNLSILETALWRCHYAKCFISNPIRLFRHSGISCISTFRHYFILFKIEKCWCPHGTEPCWVFF